MRRHGHSRVLRGVGAAARIGCRGALAMDAFAWQVMVYLAVLVAVAVLIRLGNGLQFLGYFVIAHVLGWGGYTLWYRFRCWRYWRACGCPRRVVSSERWVAQLVPRQDDATSEAPSLARPHWWPWDS